MENGSGTTGEEGARVSVLRKTYVHIFYGQSRHDSSTPGSRRKDSQRRLLQQGDYNFLNIVTMFAFLISKQFPYLFLIFTCNIRENNTNIIA